MNKVSTILIVDDILVNRELLSELIHSLGHTSLQAENGKAALDIIESSIPDLILLDIIMPIMSGFEVLQYLKSDSTLKDIPILLISAVDDMENIVKGIELGADDYLIKPFNFPILKARVRTCLEKKYRRDLEKYYLEQIKLTKDTLEACVQRQMQEITESQAGVILGMCKVAESYDNSTGNHLKRIREYCKALALEMRTYENYQSIIDDDFIDILYKACPLHDIGNISVPDAILKKTDKLSEVEFEQIKFHSQSGAKVLMDIYKECPTNELLYMGAQIAGCHHEKWDGTGYPSGLKGLEIPLPARILALGDVYDALTSRRSYKVAFSHEKSKQIILESSGSHFDPDVVNAFLSIEAIFLEIKDKFKI